MLNKNSEVQIIPEPLSSLSRAASAEQQYNTIKSAISKLENRSDLTTIGFNEKFLSSRYNLVSDSQYFPMFRSYLLSKHFKLV